AYEAIENLLAESSYHLAKFDKYDQLEIYCLQAALTPAQYWRQVNLHKIARNMPDSGLRSTVEAAHRYLTLLKNKPGARLTLK
ncbi:MAG: hypothetical protein JO279_00195, partial [Verrucomicrobia bacterium]|nr:hypothetical protein [Verrucomicrobiota bacterium]